MNKNEIKKLYNDFIITSGEEYWKYVVLEHILNNFDEKEIKKLNITEEKIEEIAFNLLESDEIWTEVDYKIENEL